MSDGSQELALPEAVLRQFYAYDRDRPLEASVDDQLVEDSESLRAQRFEITSRHDERVPGLMLWNPRAQGPSPVVLVGHPATLEKGADYVLYPIREWVDRGAVCVTIDQAGHGERTQQAPSIEDFMRFPQRRASMTYQTVVDWMRTLDYLGERANDEPRLDVGRVGFVGFSMGGMRGAPFVGLDDRVRAAAFCISGAARGAPEEESERMAQLTTDPTTFAPLMDRPTLVVAGERDDIVPPESAQRFFDAMPEPRAIDWGTYGHWDFMPRGLGAVWPFLERHLSV